MGLIIIIIIIPIDFLTILPAVYCVFKVSEFKEFWGVKENWEYDDYKDVVNKVFLGDPRTIAELTNKPKSNITFKSHDTRAE